MSSDKNNNNDNGKSSKPLLSKEVQGALNERRDEQRLFARFKHVAADALEQMSHQDDDKKKFRMGDKEAQIIQSLHGVGLLEGAAAGILTFFVLRRGPVYIGRWVRKRQMAQYQSPPPSRDGYKFSDPNNNLHNPFQRASIVSQQEFPRSGSLVVRSIWFLFDVTLSLMMAASTSMAYTDTDMIRQQIIDMPLVEGTSLTSQALCDPIVQELQTIQREKDPTYKRLQRLQLTGNPTPASMYLDHIQKFAENCQRRRYVERRIQQERGIIREETVEIPPPGVPKDGPRLVVENGKETVVRDDGSTTEDYDDDDGSGFSDDGGFGPDMSWAANDSDYSNGSNNNDASM
jgi:hypothetical protein